MRHGVIFFPKRAGTGRFAHPEVIVHSETKLARSDPLPSREASVMNVRELLAEGRASNWQNQPVGAAGGRDTLLGQRLLSVSRAWLYANLEQVPCPAPE